MKIAIVGFDIEGRVSFDYFKNLGADITICDQNPNLETPEGVAVQLGSNYLHDLDRFDVVMRTPGVLPSKILEQNPSVLSKISSGTNEFFKACPTKNIIGVTGTKGKGTTSTLIANILTAAGFRVHLGGNIGRAALDMLAEIKSDDWVVLELSNFQLCDLKYSPHIAVCLMVVPEHLDWHEDYDDYTNAKTHIFKWQTTEDIAIFFANNDMSRQIASNSSGHLIPYYTRPGAYVEDESIVVDDHEICKTDDLKLLGKFNWQNVCAAITAVRQITQDTEAIRSVLTTFSGLPHRLELVRELDGVRYYDDSFGTTPETAIVAIQAFDAPKIVILGGSDKGANYDNLAQVIVGGNVRHVLLIGEQSERIRVALEKVGYIDYVPGGDSMTEIASNARNVAQRGDVVLLSTGCASFDMFKNYKDRGNQFILAVRSLS